MEEPIDNRNYKGFAPLVSQASLTVEIPLLEQGLETFQQPEPIEAFERQPVDFDELQQWNNAIGRCSNCGEDLIIRTCSSGGPSHYTKKMYSRCNERKLCPRCAWFYAQKQARTMYDYLKTNLIDKLQFSTYITQIVLTLPEELNEISDKLLSRYVHQLVKPDDGLSDREFKRASQALYQVKHLLRPEGYNLAINELKRKRKEKGWKQAYYYVIQDQSSETPLLKHKHVHLYMVNVEYRQVTNQAGLTWPEVRRISPWYDPDKLRAKWAKIIGMTQGKTPDVHVQYANYRKDKGRILHWLAYAYRYEVWDMFKFVVRRSLTTTLEVSDGTRQEFMFTLDNPTLEQINAILNQKKKPVVWAGFLAPTTRQAAFSSLGAMTKTIEQIREEIRLKASMCPYEAKKGEKCSCELIDYKIQDKEKYDKFRLGVIAWADVPKALVERKKRYV